MKNFETEKSFKKIIFSKFDQKFSFDCALAHNQMKIFDQILKK